jgi:hypothetical protein
MGLGEFLHLENMYWHVCMAYMYVCKFVCISLFRVMESTI